MTKFNINVFTKISISASHMEYMFTIWKPLLFSIWRNSHLADSEQRVTQYVVPFVTKNKRN